MPCTAANCGRSYNGQFIRGDWDNDGLVNIMDLREYMQAYSVSMGDLNGDGVTDARDMAWFIDMITARKSR